MFSFIIFYPIFSHIGSMNYCSTDKKIAFDRYETYEILLCSLFFLPSVDYLLYAEKYPFYGVLTWYFEFSRLSRYILKASNESGR